LASTEALTASSGSSSGGDSRSQCTSEGDGGSTCDGDGNGDPQIESETSALESRKTSALETRIRTSTDGLLPAIAERIDILAKENRPQFEAALTEVVQQAQQLMQGALTAEIQRESKESDAPEKRTEVAERLTDPETYPNQIDELRAALEMLNPLELQDLLALMARKYSSQAPPHIDDGVKSHHESYEPVCASLMRLEPEDTFNATGVQQASHGGEPPLPGSGLTDLPELGLDDVILPHQWWTDHLVQQGWHELNSQNDIYLLQWVYGNVVHGSTDEFVERHRLASGGKKSIDRTIMDSFGEVAETWRHLAATMDRKRHVCTLREAVAEDIEAVEVFDSSIAASLFDQAQEYTAEVTSDPTLAAAASGVAPMDSTWSQRALGKLQRFHQLKDETSIRYAQSLIDREIAVLELAEVMDQHECDVAERELQTVDAALATAKQDLANGEFELAKAEVEGPAVHRKRDLLDRVNKEAEHRERLRELQQHIASCKERIASEEAFGAGARRRREQAAADLSEGRIELQGYLEQRQALDRACHAVLAAQERDKGQELTDAYVDARIKAVWQVVAGVADAIRLLSKRYIPGSNSKESARHLRCTGKSGSVVIHRALKGC